MRVLMSRTMTLMRNKRTGMGMRQLIRRRENGNIARKSRYVGYMKGIQQISRKGKKTSTKESVLNRLKNLKGKEFHMIIPVKEDADA